MASEASCVVPRWPTMAVSTSTYSGSAARAPSAGTARRRISRSWGERGQPPTVGSAAVKLRLYPHSDGARIAYREAGTGPPLALLHSAGLSHREFEPLVEELSDRFRLVLPDLPLHGDSEDRPRHPYTRDWVVELLAGFIREACGPRAFVGEIGRASC